MEDRGDEEGIKQQQENQERPSKSENPLHQPQPPQKCPRCDSLNTKFCYYNNYSLSQPRYFCKTCRRYWTQGGTLRNVPVGGGFRKAKRSHASSSSGTDNSRSKQPPPPLSSLQLQHQQQQVQVPRNLAALSTMVPASANSILQITSSIPHHYYSDGGFLSSLAAVQSLSQPPSITNQVINAGDHQYVGGDDDLLQGRNVQTLGSQQTQPHHHQFHQIGSRDKNTKQMYPFDQNMVQPSRTVGSWTHNFWSNSNTSNATNSSITPGNSSEPNQWPNLPDYGPPHP